MIILTPDQTGGEPLAIDNGQVKRVVIGETICSVWDIEEALGSYHKAGVSDQEHASLVILGLCAGDKEGVECLRSTPTL